MTQRIMPRNVEARFEACQRMAARVGLDTVGWRLYRSDKTWCASTASGEGVFGSGHTFAADSKSAYQIMGGFLAAFRAMDRRMSDASYEAEGTRKQVVVSRKYGIMADPFVPKGTIDTPL